ncbi:MAG: glycosyltransferase [Gammaproteobacteria bacterium]|nr:glycosyltransferase [Gammaproteobacteria bacterium]
MRILYGVQTTGQGHLVRSTPIIRALRDRGHEVDVLLSGPPADPSWMARIGPPVVQRPGLTFIADGGRVRYLATARAARPLAFLADVLRRPALRPDLVVTDYEPVTAWMARRARLRSVGLGHLYAFAWPEVPRARGNPVTRTVLRHFAPATVAAGTHWAPFGAPLLPPTIDPDLRGLRREAIEDDLVLVYLAFEPLERLVPLLRQMRHHRFHVYARVPVATADGNVAVRPLSRPAFLADLGRCGGVVANAGFTLASECLHLGIRLLVQPIEGHLEQESNAMALEELALATATGRLTRGGLATWLGTTAPASQRYPDVTGAVTDWLDGGAEEDLAALSARLWADCRS